MISKHVRKHFPVLKIISKMKEGRRQRYIKHHNPNSELYKCFEECSRNLLKGNIKLTKPQSKKLRRYKKELRALANTRTTGKKKQKIVQTGGFLQALLVPAVATLGGLLMKRLFSEKKQ